MLELFMQESDTRAVKMFWYMNSTCTEKCWIIYTNEGIEEVKLTSEKCAMHFTFRSIAVVMGRTADTAAWLWCLSSDIYIVENTCRGIAPYRVFVRKLKLKSDFWKSLFACGCSPTTKYNKQAGAIGFKTQPNRQPL